MRQDVLADSELLMCLSESALVAASVTSCISSRSPVSYVVNSTADRRGTVRSMMVYSLGTRLIRGTVVSVRTVGDVDIWYRLNSCPGNKP